MPDQSSAATEHSIIQEITRPLDSLPDDPLEIVNAEFPTALRGYDRMAVDDFVRRTRQLVAELQATRSPEAAVRRALERVGEQIGGILKRAHETAEQITAQSRSEAEDRLQQARLEARQLIDNAEQRVRDLDADTDRIWLERQRIVADAEDLAAQLHAVARTATERFPEDDEAGPSDPLGEEVGAGEAGAAGIIGPDAELAQPETLAADAPMPDPPGEPGGWDEDVPGAPAAQAPPDPAGGEEPEPLKPFDGETTVETAEHAMYGVGPDDEADFFSGEDAPARPAPSEVEQTMAFRPLSEDPSRPSEGTEPEAVQQGADSPDPDATQIIRPSSQAAHRRHDS
jgi:DivIVA domain-containing protein